MQANSPVLFCLDDPRFDGHVAPAGHPEREARLQAVRRGLVDTLIEGGAERVTPREVAREEALRAHSATYLDELERALVEGHGSLDADTYLSPGTRTAAHLAAGAGVQLVERLLAHPSAIGVLAGRPPGHHATRDRAMGFCLLNNVAIAAAAALAQGAERVAIVDWDVHHGNGTQDIFENDPRVLFVSLHQWPLYPGTGRPDEIGLGEARGRTVNLALPSSSTGKDYGAALGKVVTPALEQFAPDLLLVSSGFDAHRDDPLAGMALEDGDFGAMATWAWELAVRLGKPRLGIVLEGGYDLNALERASRCVGRALLGQRYALDEGRVTLQAERAIDATRRALKDHVEL